MKKETNADHFDFEQKEMLLPDKVDPNQIKINDVNGSRSPTRMSEEIVTTLSGAYN